MKKLAILSGGNNHAGINSAVRSIVRTVKHKYEIYGVERGFEGLINNRFKKLHIRDSVGIIGKPGCIFDSAMTDLPSIEKDFPTIFDTLHQRKIESLILIGGNRIMNASQRFIDKGFQIVTIPSTIQDDVPETDITLGCDSAANIVCQNIELIRSNGTSRNRAFVVEVAGERNGFLAWRCGIASGAELILTKENSSEDFELDRKEDF